MLIVATDEAGYGPKLGPLLIAASVWQCPPSSNVDLSNAGEDSLNDWFGPLAKSVQIAGVTVRVDDSKAIYQSGDGLSRLHAVVCASHVGCGHAFGDVREMLGHVIDDDIGDVLATPWLGKPCSEPMLSPEETQPATDQWQSGGCRLLDVKARAITAKRFNEFCESGLNKADLLSQSTLQLVRRAIQSSTETDIRVYCDRHGGRRYYAGVIQHVFDDGQVQVVSESKAESVYQCQWQGKRIRLAFTVKGDRFAPVAMSSLHAKYIRERLMESFNAYFGEHHQGKAPLKPTAGYPVDANRFLDETTKLRKRLGISDHDLIRVR